MHPGYKIFSFLPSEMTTNGGISAYELRVLSQFRPEQHHQRRRSFPVIESTEALSPTGKQQQSERN